MPFWKYKYFAIITLLVLTIICGLLAFWLGRPLTTINNSIVTTDTQQLEKQISSDLDTLNEKNIIDSFGQNMANSDQNSQNSQTTNNVNLQNNSNSSVTNYDTPPDLTLTQTELFVTKRLNSGQKIYQVSQNFVQQKPFVTPISTPAVNIDPNLLSKTNYLFVGDNSNLQLISSDAEFYGEFVYQENIYWFFGVQKNTGNKALFLSKQNLQNIQKLDIYQNDIIQSITVINDQVGTFGIKISDSNGKNATVINQILDLKSMIK